MSVSFLPCYVSPSDAISGILKMQSTMCLPDISLGISSCCAQVLGTVRCSFSPQGSSVAMWLSFRLLPEPCWNTIPQSSHGSPRVYTKSSASAIRMFGCPHCWSFRQHSHHHRCALADLLPSTSLMECQVCGTRGYSSLPQSLNWWRFVE